MSKKLTKVERAIWKSIKRRKRWPKASGFRYDSAETFEAALDNARHHNNQHRPTKTESTE